MLVVWDPRGAGDAGEVHVAGGAREREEGSFDHTKETGQSLEGHFPMKARPGGHQMPPTTIISTYVSPSPSSRPWSRG